MILHFLFALFTCTFYTLFSDLFVGFSLRGGRKIWEKRTRTRTRIRNRDAGDEKAYIHINISDTYSTHTHDVHINLYRVAYFGVIFAGHIDL